MEYSQVVVNFLRYLGSIDRSEETIIGYEKELGYFEKFLGERYLVEVCMKDITLEDLEDYMVLLKVQGKKDSTRSRVVYIFRSLYKYAYKREHCEKELALFLEPIRVKRRERVYLEEEEMLELFSHIKKPILKAAIQTMFYTGMRVSEVTNLKLETLDMEDRLIYIVNGKGNKDRMIPMSQKLHRIIEEYMVYTRPAIQSDRVFCTERSGSLSTSYINAVLQQAAESMGLEKRVSAHVLRHSFASRLIKANVALPHLQKLLGHADLRVTSLYIHQSIDQLRDAVELM